MVTRLGCRFPLSMDRFYRGFLSYVLQKHDLFQNDPLEQPTLEGIKLMLCFIILFPSIWRGYRRFPEPDASIQREIDRGNRVLLSEDRGQLILKLRIAS